MTSLCSLIFFLPCRELFDITTEEEKSKDDWTSEISSGLVVTCLVFFDFEEKLLYQAAGTMDFVMKQALGGEYVTTISMLPGSKHF